MRSLLAGRMRGGLEFRSYVQTVDRRVVNASLPKVVVIPLAWGMMEASHPVVKPGDEVKEGQLLAKPASVMGAPLYSSVPGRVRDIVPVSLPEGEREAVILDLAGTFERRAKVRTSDWADMTPEKLWKRLFSSGVIRHGNVPLPIGRFLPPPGRKAEALVCACFSAEPWRYTEELLLDLRREAVAEGLRILVRTVMPKEVHLVVPEEERTISRLLVRDLGDPGIPVRVHHVARRYPFTSDEMLLELVGGARLTWGRLPVDEGFVIAEPSTLLAVRDAVVGGRPVLEQVVLVGGDAVQRPVLVKVRLGMPVFDLLSQEGTMLGPDADPRVFLGGPLSGREVSWLGAPLLPGVDVVTLLGRGATGGEEPCIHCSRCAQVCPRGLEPWLLHEALGRGDGRLLTGGAIEGCIGCNLCSFVCPSAIPLADRFRDYLEKEREGHGEG
ncbi:NADH dehydrogenase [Spirochaeta thermophila]|uniref:Transporter n=1 Tax=Winmispira thermophila (strain ATCC 49972 / DSM 6192 / RI 19.B1) TaxID=665571 RepID=E0RPU9_WINT6|nr:NADH dehydrogenase [Spirochaeta thermophila]ADN01413.1 transporter [Spirochaeta thermophila DSM 6192]